MVVGFLLGFVFGMLAMAFVVGIIDILAVARDGRP